MAGIYFSQTSVINLSLRFSCCPYCRSVCDSKVSARRELTIARNYSGDEQPLRANPFPASFLGAGRRETLGTKLPLRV